MSVTLYKGEAVAMVHPDIVGEYLADNWSTEKTELPLFTTPKTRRKAEAPSPTPESISPPEA